MEVPTEEPKNEPLADDVQPMDVEEAADDQTNQEKQEALNKMEEIEDCFSELKNRLFSAKIEAVKLEIQEVKEVLTRMASRAVGTHEKFWEECLKVEEAKISKIRAADRFRQYRLQTVQAMFDAEKKQAEDEYEAEKLQQQERMAIALNEKLKRLEEEKQNMMLGDDARPIIKKLRRRVNEATVPSAIKKNFSPPQVHYTLRESEMMEDLEILQKGSFPSQRANVLQLAKQHMRVRGNSLFVYGERYAVDDEVVYEVVGGVQRTEGRITSIQPTEITVVDAQETSTKVFLAHLRSGKATITRKMVITTAAS